MNNQRFSIFLVLDTIFLFAHLVGKAQVWWLAAVLMAVAAGESTDPISCL